MYFLLLILPRVVWNNVLEVKHCSAFLVNSSSALPLLTDIDIKIVGTFLLYIFSTLKALKPWMGAGVSVR